MTRWLVAPVGGALLTTVALHPAAGFVGVLAVSAVALAGGRRCAVGLVVLVVVLANLDVRVDEADPAPRPAARVR